jgi:hypothetical protein
MSYLIQRETGATFTCTADQPIRLFNRSSTKIGSFPAEVRRTRAVGAPDGLVRRRYSLGRASAVSNALYKRLKLALGRVGSPVRNLLMRLSLLRLGYLPGCWLRLLHISCRRKGGRFRSGRTRRGIRSAKADAEETVLRVSVQVPARKRIVPNVCIEVEGLRILQISVRNGIGLLGPVWRGPPPLCRRQVPCPEVIQPCFRVPFFAGTTGSDAGIVQERR